MSPEFGGCLKCNASVTHSPVLHVAQPHRDNCLGLLVRAAQKVAVISPGFSTHSQQMSQRYLFLSCTCPTPVAQMVANSAYVAVVTCACKIPDNFAVAPIGDYLITLLDGGVPSEAQWISISA